MVINNAEIQAQETFVEREVVRVQYGRRQSVPCIRRRFATARCPRRERPNAPKDSSHQLPPDTTRQSHWCGAPTRFGVHPTTGATSGHDYSEEPWTAP